jgi:predicted O-methyltransferase YrrM
MHLPWRDVDGISTSLTQAETAKLQQLATDGFVLEIGSAYGHSAVNMAHTARHVTAVDPHDGYGSLPGSYEQMCVNLDKHGVRDKVTIVRSTSSEWFGPAFSRVYDLVFVDGDHREEAVLADVNAAWGALKSGGVLACHDYGEESCPGVKAALDKWAQPDEIVDSLWIRRLNCS